MNFRNEYKFLSNMHPCVINIKSKENNIYTFKCLESAYQSLKDRSRLDEFIHLNGYEAKKLGKIVHLDSKFNENRKKIMSLLLSNKFSQRHLSIMLKRTGNIEIVEDNNWGDTYWGRCRGIGENNLGKAIMNVRDNLNLELCKTVCFTGSRPKNLRGYCREDYTNDKEIIKNYIYELYNKGFREFITGGAQGVDQLVLECLVELKEQLSSLIITVFLPYFSYGNQWNFGDYFSYKHLKNLLISADYVSYVNHVTYEHEINKALFNRNEAMVECSDLVVAIYKVLTNGTKHCINYARDRNREIREIILK